MRKGNFYTTGPGGVWVLSPAGTHLGTIEAAGDTRQLRVGRRWQDAVHDGGDRDLSGQNAGGPEMNRRQFLESVAVVGAVASVGRSVLGRGLHDDATGDSRLPDGTPYAAWEQPLTFSKTYYVDNGDPKADDNGPGTKRAPLPHHQQGRPAAASWRARGDRLGHLS